MKRNKEAVRLLFEEVFNNGRVELLQDLVSDDYVGARGEKGAAAFQAQTAGLIAAFPDIQYQLKELIGEDDIVAVRWTWNGTHNAPFNAIPATGISVASEGMGIYGCRDGKIVSGNIQTDRLGFLQQLGILPVNPVVAAAAGSGSPLTEASAGK